MYKCSNCIFIIVFFRDIYYAKYYGKGGDGQLGRKKIKIRRKGKKEKRTKITLKKGERP